MTLNNSNKRAIALDALRGIAIIGMVLSGSIPYGGMLPSWMYHAQVPPPNHVFNPNLPGLTWVDLVFPFFLFAMGAAFPFALSKKTELGEPNWKIILQAIKRGLLIAAFAIYIQHIKPWAIEPSPTTVVWFISIVGFLLLFPMLIKLPNTISKPKRIVVKLFGYLGGILIMFLFGYFNEQGFSLGRSDIIILVLANVAVAGSIIWLFTKENMIARLGILGLLIALRLTQSVDGSWNSLIWNFSPFPWLYKLYYLQYLFIVIPGTIIGDMILKWMKSITPNDLEITADRKGKIYMQAAIMFISILGNLIGLYSRAIPETILFNIIIIIFGFYLFNNTNNKTDEFLKSLFSWGTYWLILGLFFEAYEGGIKKDHPTLSYYFVTTGLAIYCYIGFTIILDYLGHKKYFQSVIENGQNPMIAYIVGHTLITPILALTTLGTLLNYLLINPWLGFLKGAIFTSLVVAVTSFCTKHKWFWRT